MNVCGTNSHNRQVKGQSGVGVVKIFCDSDTSGSKSFRLRLLDSDSTTLVKASQSHDMVESQELSSHFESLLCKLESMSSHTKFHVFSTFFLLWNGAQHAIKWRLIS